MPGIPRESIRAHRHEGMGGGVRRKPSEGRVPLIDFLIINLPVWLFLAGLCLCGALMVALRPAFPLILAFAVPAWWCACGALMLSIDYSKRKKTVYLRIRRAGPPGPSTPLGKSLRQTLCGAMVYLAVQRYARTART
jgi:hypothetical protein